MGGRRLREVDVLGVEHLVRDARTISRMRLLPRQYQSIDLALKILQTRAKIVDLGLDLRTPSRDLHRSCVHLQR
jgi:hypothetical protein